MRLNVYGNLTLLAASIATASCFSQNPVDNKEDVAQSLPKKATSDRTLNVPFTVSHKTTRVTKHLTEKGFPNYEAALNAHYSKGVTKENNANILFWEAFGPKPEGSEMPQRFFRLMDSERPPEEGNVFVDLSTYLSETAGIDKNSDTMSQHLELLGNTKPWKAEQHPLLAAWLAANENSLSKLVAGTQRTEYFSPFCVSEDGKTNELLVGMLLPAIQKSRSGARALVTRAMLHAGEGRNQAAMNDLIASHRLGRLIGRGPTLIEALVGIAIDGMSIKNDIHLINHGSLSQEELADFRKRLHALPPLPKMASKVDTGERFVYLDVAVNLASGQKATISEVLGADATISTLLSKFAEGGIDWDVVMINGNRWYDRLVACLEIENRQEMKAERDRIENELLDLSKKTGGVQQMLKLVFTENRGAVVGESISNVLAALLIPAVGAARDAEDRALQQMEVLKVGLALATYQKKNGSYPETLKDLTTSLQYEIPTDRFANAPLKYKTDVDSCMVYSVGRNEKDDRGLSFDDQPQGDDLVVKLKLN